YLFFFSSRRRHTIFSRDWSSDVCSSDLPHQLVSTRGRSWLPCTPHSRNRVHGNERNHAPTSQGRKARRPRAPRSPAPYRPAQAKIGRASCRERAQTSAVAGSPNRQETRR